MIDIKELRIGSCICYYKNGFENVIYDKIKSIYFNDEDESYHFEFDKPNFVHAHLTKEGIEPIPITEELLLKLGFIFKDNIYYSPEYRIGNRLKVIGFDGNYIVSFNMYFNIDIKYLHQLQNIYCAITGDELEVKL